MPDPEVLDALLVDRGRLKAVFDIDPTCPGSALAFQFETGITIASVTPLDAVALADVGVALPDDPSAHHTLAALRGGDTRELVALTPDHPWSTLVDNSVIWAWNLTNNQGYCDGVQLEFIEAESQATTTILQLMAEGGRFSFRFFQP